ncbi:MAG: hypothetical protein P8Z49_08795 [Acidobacteriota bacterium]
MVLDVATTQVSDPQGVRKSMGRVCLSRGFAVLAPMVGLGLVYLSRSMGSGRGRILGLVAGLILLFWLIVIHDVFSFKFDYSTLGILKRTRPVTGENVIAQSRRAPLFCRVYIGKAWFPAWTPYRILLYPSGVEVRLIGKQAFVPRSMFSEVKRISRRPSWFELYHRSPEVKSPIGFGDEVVYRACLKLTNEKGCEKD